MAYLILNGSKIETTNDRLGRFRDAFTEAAQKLTGMWIRGTFRAHSSGSAGRVADPLDHGYQEFWVRPTDDIVLWFDAGAMPSGDSTITL